MLTGEGCLPKLLKERRETGAVWYVYFLKLSNNDTYVGSTNDLRRRANFTEMDRPSPALTPSAHIAAALQG